MRISLPFSTPPITRRNFLKTGLYGAAGLALYSGEIARHWIEVTQRDFYLRGLPSAMSGMRIAQISDIHLDAFTEPFFLRHVVDRINAIRPDAVFLTGDFVTATLGAELGAELGTHKFARGAAWQCANILTGLECKALYAVLGNHDFGVGPREVATALETNGITVLRNASVPLERAGARIWLAGVDDPVEGHPNPELAIPETIRNVPNEPVVLLCHAPDYADRLLRLPVGQAVDLMLSGHTHGGQVRFPFVRAVHLPPMGRKYLEGWFQLGRLQLYVNRGIGTIGLPFRLNCPPEITVITLRASEELPAVSTS
jgi:predicted MPP superfamily phosphohydrolase